MQTACEAVRVTVHYMAAEGPFKDHDADPGETIGALKSRVLAAFGLTDEGPSPDGNQVLYDFFAGKDKLENLGQTLGDLAGRDCGVQLKLVKQIIQGCQS